MQGSSTLSIILLQMGHLSQSSFKTVAQIYLKSAFDDRQIEVREGGENSQVECLFLTSPLLYPKTFYLPLCVLLWFFKLLVALIVIGI